MSNQIGLVAPAVLLCLAGCASWDQTTESAVLPTPRMSPDSVVLEIAFVRAPLEMAGDIADMWGSIDEQHLPREERRRLTANGLRTGIAGAQLPAALRRLLDESEQPLESAPTPGALGEEIFVRRRRLPSRAGQPAKIVAVAQPRERMVVLLDELGYFRGEEFAQARGVFSLLSFPQGDGRVRLQLTPTIEHGALRNRWVGGEQSFMMHAQRDTRQFDDLRIDAMLSPGQWLIVTGTPEAKGLGSQFFTDPAHAGEPAMMMLIRLAQTQRDDLFAEDRSLAAELFADP